MIVDKTRQENVDIENIKKGYSISRKMASRLLNVSTRTIDRYVKDDKLSAVTIDGRIWLKKGEISDIRFRRSHAISDPVVRMSTLDMSIDKVVDSKVVNVDSVDNVDRHQSSKKEKIELFSDRLEKIEKQLSNSISFSEHHDKILNLKIDNKNLERKLEKKERANQELSTKFKKTYIKQYVFLIILLLLIALQPLWILIHFDKLF